jgi:hypothetical protein
MVRRADKALAPPKHGARRYRPAHPEAARQEPDQRGKDRAAGPVQSWLRTCPEEHGDLKRGTYFLAAVTLAAITDGVYRLTPG